ncbi:MAG: alkaline phosphatase family protein [Candidatus Cybelea sp.]
MKPRFIAVLALVAAAGCDFPSASSQGTPRGYAAPATRMVVAPNTLTHGKISHVVIIFQENRSVDNLFAGLKGADTVKYGLNSAGKRITLRPIPLTAPYDLDHEHRAYVTESDNGKLDGFNLVRQTCRPGNACTAADRAAYGYVPQTQVEPYFDMAEQYAFADRMFQTNQGPSFPAHQYIISGTSTISQGSSLRASENPFAPTQSYTGGCNSPKGSLVLLIDQNGQELQEMYPCFDRPTLMDLATTKGLTWRYYESKLGAGLWNGPDAIQHLAEGSQFSTDVVAPPSQVLTDIANGDLANVVWVTPKAADSDHADVNKGRGPAWVASVVNAIGESKYWDSTAIIVTWDDWGGWYDHVPPPTYNSYELGFRVPAIVISAYAKQAYVSHKQHEFGSILKFVEMAFGLGSLGTTDERADDLRDCFDFSKKPRTFTPIPASLRARYFLDEPPGDAPVDDGF